jgi:T-complex protein 1 subunit delta
MRKDGKCQQIGFFPLKNFQLVDLSHSQDVEAGDGTTTVTVIAGSLLNACQHLLDKGIHPTTIAESFLAASRKAEEILEGMSVRVDLADRQSLLSSATTSLSSKVRLKFYFLL